MTTTALIYTNENDNNVSYHAIRTSQGMQNLPTDGIKQPKTSKSLSIPVLQTSITAIDLQQLAKQSKLQND